VCGSDSAAQGRSPPQKQGSLRSIQIWIISRAPVAVDRPIGPVKAVAWRTTATVRPYHRYGERPMGTRGPRSIVIGVVATPLLHGCHRGIVLEGHHLQPAMPSGLAAQPLPRRPRSGRARLRPGRAAGQHQRRRRAGHHLAVAAQSFTRYGLGMPPRNPEAIRQRAIDAARQRASRPAIPSLDPVFVALNHGELPVRARSGGELAERVRRWGRSPNDRHWR
jgi:hypothetical protein